MNEKYQKIKIKGYVNVLKSEDPVLELINFTTYSSEPIFDDINGQTCTLIINGKEYNEPDLEDSEDLSDEVFELVEKHKKNTTPHGISEKELDNGDIVLGKLFKDTNVSIVKFSIWEAELDVDIKLDQNEKEINLEKFGILCRDWIYPNGGDESMLYGLYYNGEWYDLANRAKLINNITHPNIIYKRK